MDQRGIDKKRCASKLEKAANELLESYFLLEDELEKKLIDDMRTTLELMVKFKLKEIVYEGNESGA